MSTFTRKGISKISRYIFFAFLFALGLMHFINPGGMSTTIEPVIFAGEQYLIYLTGLAMLTGSLFLLLNRKITAMLYTLGFILLLSISVLHLPAFIIGSGTPALLLKDLSVLAAIILVAPVYSDTNKAHALSIKRENRFMKAA